MGRPILPFHMIGDGAAVFLALGAMQTLLCGCAAWTLCWGLCGPCSSVLAPRASSDACSGHGDPLSFCSNNDTAAVPPSSPALCTCQLGWEGVYCDVPAPVLQNGNTAPVTNLKPGACAPVCCSSVWTCGFSMSLYPCFWLAVLTCDCGVAGSLVTPH